MTLNGPACTEALSGDEKAKRRERTKGQAAVSELSQGVSRMGQSQITFREDSLREEERRPRQQLNPE